MRDITAPEFSTKLTWFNSQPLKMSQLRGQVVLIDFWTYSCINCQRTLPYLRSWWEKYAHTGLVIIGVHTPEFEFEKDASNVRQALNQYQVSWPVVLDNDYQIWNAFANHYWPAKYLVNYQGQIVYSHFGEGNYQEAELEIQQALKEAGFKVTDQLIGQLVEEKASLGQTPELYCGHRGSVLKAPDESSLLQPDQIYLVGAWRQGPGYLEHDRETKDLEDILVLKYRAKKVYLVMESASGKPIKVYLTLDGVGVKDNGAGRDVSFDEEGRGFIAVSFSTLYNLIETDRFGEHILRLSTTVKGLRLYAFTFGS